MQWHELMGHALQQQWFQTALSQQRLASSFLFVGPTGIGKHTFAKLLAQSLLCTSTAENELDHCGTCESCVQVVAGTHPDLLHVSKPPDRAFIPIELFIGEREKRMREGLCHDISLRPYSGRRKIAIVDDADTLNMEGANCLLKTLEEPPLNSLLILIGTSLPRQLPTIRSRCQSILFRPLPPGQLAKLLLREEIVDSQAAADDLAMQVNGSLADARQLMNPEIREFHRELANILSMHTIPIVELAKQCGRVVDAAGKDSRAKRDRMKLIFRFAADFFRTISLCLSQSTSEDRGPEDAAALRLTDTEALSAAQHWRHGPAEAVRCWQGCLTAMEHVDRNANQASLLETWAANMARSSGC